MARKKSDAPQDDIQNQNPNEDENGNRLYGDDIGENVDTNAGPDASDGGVANAKGYEED